MQSCLEKRGITSRKEHLVRRDYNKEEEYSANHADAISNGDALGKGSGHGGHQVWLPDCNKPTSLIDYSNFDTDPNSQIGGKYDVDGYNGIGGRKQSLIKQLYNQDYQYGPNLINTEESLRDGQYRVN